MKRIFSALCLLFIFHTSSKAQLIIYNGTFDSLTVDAQGDTTPVNWTVPGGFGGESTTDAYQTNYAAVIYNYSNTVKGQMFYGNTNSPDHTGMPILAMPNVLNGYYKYIPGNNDGSIDSAEVRVNVTLFDHFNGETDTVASGRIFLTPASSYTAFTVNIQSPVGTPAADTLQIQFISSVNGACNGSADSTCCHLYIDELTLEFPNGVEQIIGASPDVYYDGLQNRLNVQTSNAVPVWSIGLVDVTGREVFRSADVRERFVELPDDIASGLYLYHIRSGSRAVSGKVMLNR